MTIKELGNYTSQLKNLTTGIPIILDGPYGTFTPLADSRKKVFIDGGIGITPFRSVLSSWCKNKHDKPETVLLWSVQGVKDIIDASFYEQMSETHSWFTFRPMLTGEQNPKYDYGRITSQQLDKVLSPSVVDTPDVYLCGPAAMFRHMNRQCRIHGIRRKNIHLEQFSFYYNP